MGWILETNTPMNRGMEAMGGRVVKRYRMYERELPGGRDHAGRVRRGVTAAVRVREVKAIAERVSSPLRRSPAASRKRRGRDRGLD